MREMPTSKPATIWRADGRWFLRESAAYYAIAKKLVAKKYPRWLDDHDLDNATVDGGSVLGDFHAQAEGIENWRARRERKQELFWRFRSSSWDEYDYEGFDPDKWKAFVRRVARFLMFVDRRRAELAANEATA